MYNTHIFQLILWLDISYLNKNKYIILKDPVIPFQFLPYWTSQQYLIVLLCSLSWLQEQHSHLDFLYLPWHLVLSLSLFYTQSLGSLIHVSGLHDAKNSQLYFSSSEFLREFQPPPCNHLLGFQTFQGELILSPLPNWSNSFRHMSTTRTTIYQALSEMEKSF